MKTTKDINLNKFKEGDLVRVKDTWWDYKVAGTIWIVGDPDWFDKVYLIHPNSRERYLNNVDLNYWANDHRIKKTQVPNEYLESFNWKDYKENKKGGVTKMPRVFRYIIYFSVSMFIYRFFTSIDINLLINKLFGLF